MNIFYKKRKNEEDIDEYYKNTVSDYKDERAYFKGNNLKYLVKSPRSNLSKKDFLADFYNNIEKLTSLGLKPSDILFGYDNDYQKKTFTQVELDNLKKLEKISNLSGVNVGIFDWLNIFDYKSVANADKIIKEKANEIKKNNYSPIEKLLHAYLIVSDREYIREDVNFDDASKSRSVYGILNNKEIVCCGYSEYLRAIVNELGDENLKVFANAVVTKYYEHAKLVFDWHQNNIVYIKDDKYNIDGFYYLDPTWDYKKKNSLKFFMLEIKEIKNLYADIVGWYKQEYSRKKRPKSNYIGPKKFKVKRKNYNYMTSVLNRISISYKAADVVREMKATLNSDTSDMLLSKYLLTRQDFKDYVILRETLDNKKYNKNLSFDEFLEKNAELVEKDIMQTYTIYNDKKIFKYLKQHSPHVDVGAMQNALQVVFKATNPQLSKDEISKNVYEIINQNIKDGYRYYYNNSSLWTECEPDEQEKEV